MFPIYEHRNNDERVREALRRIHTKYGQVCEVLEGGQVLAHGRDEDLDTGDLWDQVWLTGGNEVLPSDNLINTVVSTDSGDTQEVEIEGLTLNGGVFTRVIQIVTLTGDVDKPLPTPLARVVRLTNTGTTNFAGTVTVRQSVAGTVHITIPPVYNNSLKAANTVANDEYFLLAQLAGSVVSTANTFIRFSLQVRPVGGVFLHQPMLVVHSYSPFSAVDFDPLLVVPPNSDIRVEALTTASNVAVDGWVSGFVAKKVV